MLGIMDELGNSTQSTYRTIGVVDKEIIYMVIDDMIGHGTNEAGLEYSKYLVENYNILVCHQVPWSPKTNMIGLVVWMTVQYKVKNITAARSKNMIPFLSLSIMHGVTWNNINSPKYGSVFLRSWIS